MQTSWLAEPPAVRAYVRRRFKENINLLRIWWRVEPTMQEARYQWSLVREEATRMHPKKCGGIHNA